MKKVLCSLGLCLVLAVSFLSVPGCSTLNTPDQDDLNQTLYIVGRLAAHAYLAEKPELDDRTSNAIKTAYTVFCALLDDGTQIDSGTAVYDLLVARLGTKLGPADAALAADAVQLFWTYFKREIDVDAVSGPELRGYLQNFRKGIDQVLNMAAAGTKARQLKTASRR